jgi:glycosyltransferase involved in cell wall biosynthesis
MKILYVAPNINHHQVPFAEELIRIIGVNNFKYAVMNPTETDRIQLGFPEYNNLEWLIKPYKNDDQNVFNDWFLSSDVVLCSDRSLIQLFKLRLKDNKLTFYFSERWWKPPFGKLRLLYPRYFKLSFDFWKLYKNPNFYYLAQGGYAAKDMQFICNYKKRILDFGYFTEVSANKKEKESNSRLNILWCGRMLKWKRVSSIIKAFSLITNENNSFHLTLIGEGIEKNKLEKLANKLLPNSSYSFASPKQNIDIRKIMNQSDIFILSSSGYEGWGAVLNEAMAERCAVIASVESGAGKSIIVDSQNGILFKSRNWRMLSKKIKLLSENENLLNEIKSNGQKSINEIWSPKVSAYRFIKVCDALLENKDIPKYEIGPMHISN